MADDAETTRALERWNAELSGMLGVPPADVAAILSLTSVVAHSVVRPAGPVATFLVGYAAALQTTAGVPADQALAAALEAARTLATSSAADDAEA